MRSGRCLSRLTFLTACLGLGAAAGRDSGADGSSEQDVAAVEDRPRVASLAWLTGMWGTKTEERAIEETWGAPLGGLMVGTSRETRQARAEPYEFRTLEDTEESVALRIRRVTPNVAATAGESATIYSLSWSDVRFALFENREVEFPQKIAFRLDTEGRLSVRRTGTRYGKAVSERESLARIDRKGAGEGTGQDGDSRPSDAAANEIAAIATLRNIISAQAQLQQSAKADVDGDGTGEYGGFVELSGSAAGRMAAVLKPPVLSGAFRVLNAAGEVSRSGYLFRIYLPGPRGVDVGETRTGFQPATLDADLSETTWCCYAWPVSYGESGKRSFFTNQGGDITATETNTYSGPGTGPAGDAAFNPPAGAIVGSVAIAATGNDGQVWRQVN